MKKGNNVKEKIKSLYEQGLSIEQIKVELNITKGHYVNDVIWAIKNKK